MSAEPSYWKPQSDMRKSLLGFFLPVILLPVIMQAQRSSIYVTGAVSGLWSADTVVVTGDVIVNAGDLLTIDPGTLIVFTGHFIFDVKGAISAIGTEADQVRFTVQDTTGFHDTLTNSGGWHGFVFEHLALSADSSVFEHCIFEFGKAFSADTFGQYGGAFRVFDFDRIAFHQCTFTNNYAIKWGGAVYVNNSNLLFDRCLFSANSCGLSVSPWGYGGGLCSNSSEPVVVNCLFDGNVATGFGGGASFESSDPVVQFNTFTNNLGGLAGGFGYLRSTPTRVASNNLVCGNTARFFGGGVACIRSNTVFSNMTVTGNSSMYGGGFYCNDSAVPVLYNTILFGDQGIGHEVYIWDVRSAPSFRYCDIEGDTTAFAGSGAQAGYHGIYENNIDMDPLFRNTGDEPYALQPGSPCIDTGTLDTTGLLLPLYDLEGLSRVYNGRIDIGAYERNPGQGIWVEPAAPLVLSCFPNPAHDHVELRLNTHEVSAGTLTVYSFTGLKVYESGRISIRPGQNNLKWDLKDLSGNRVKPGSYFIRFNGSCGVLVVQ